MLGDWGIQREEWNKLAIARFVSKLRQAAEKIGFEDELEHLLKEVSKDYVSYTW